MFTGHPGRVVYVHNTPRMTWEHTQHTQDNLRTYTNILGVLWTFTGHAQGMLYMFNRSSWACCVCSQVILGCVVYVHRSSQDVLWTYTTRSQDDPVDRCIWPENIYTTCPGWPVNIHNTPRACCEHTQHAQDNLWTYTTRPVITCYTQVIPGWPVVYVHNTSRMTCWTYVPG